MVWTLSAAVGACFSTWNFIQAVRDLRALGPIANGRRLLGRGHVRREAIRVFISSAWLAIGLWSVWRFGLGHLDWDPVIVVLVVTNLACTVQAFSDYRERIALRRMFG